jgi:hypothetical protein
MSEFQQPAPDYRLSETMVGDSMKRIALRELGTAELWVDLVMLNELRPPYIVDDEARRGAGVLVAGDLIKVPAATSTVSSAATPDEVFGRDVAVVGGVLQFDSGDLAVNTGEQNFLQALRHRIQVRKRELAFHPTYGNFAPMLIGRGNGPTVGRLAAFYVRSAILEDPRVADVLRCTAQISGDTVLVSADVQPISGRVLNLNTVI